MSAAEDLDARPAEPRIWIPGCKEGVLYVGQSIDVGGRVGWHHERIGDLRRLVTDAAAIDLYATPILRMYEGDPDRVERALVARHGFPPWNVAPIPDEPGPLVLRDVVIGSTLLSRKRQPGGGYAGGYSIGILTHGIEPTELLDRVRQHLDRRVALAVSQTRGPDLSGAADRG